MTFDTRLRWLKFASTLTFGFGLVIAAAAVPELAMPTALLADLIFYPIDGLPAIAASSERLLSAIGGGVMTGWGVMLYMITDNIVTREPAAGRRLILAGIGAWYVIDSSMSIAAGAPLNALFNTVFLLLFVVPVWSLGKPGIAGSAAVS